MNYTIKIEKCENVVETVIVETIQEAKKAIRKLIKKYSLVRHAGHIVNYSKHTELWSNF